jgi:very-short-patch-repair endonuclease
MREASVASAEMRTERARRLRRDASDAENRLWYVLRNRNLNGLKFVRQLSIGPFFADFACREAALIVELDGGQHDGLRGDERRTAYLNAQGYSVLRFWNNEVLENRDGVLDAMLRVIAQNPSPDLRFAPATLSPTGRGIRGALASAAAVSSNGTEPAFSSPRRGEGGAVAPGEGYLPRRLKFAKGSPA